MKRVSGENSGEQTGEDGLCGTRRGGVGNSSMSEICYTVLCLKREQRIGLQKTVGIYPPAKIRLSFRESWAGATRGAGPRRGLKNTVFRQLP